MQYILIKLPNWLGDAVMLTPTLSLLHTVLGDVKILLVGNALSTSVFSENELILKIFLDRSKEKKSVFARLQATKMLADEINAYLEKENICMLDCTITAQNNFFSAFLLSKIKTKKSVGYGDRNILGFRKFLLTHPIDFTSGRAPFCMHQVLAYLNLVLPVLPDAFFQNTILDSNHVHYNEHATEKQNKIFINAPELKLYLPIVTQKGGEKKCIALSTSASFGISKMWLAEYFTQTIIGLITSGFCVRIYGAPNEVKRNEEIYTNALRGLSNDLHDKIQNLSGKTNITQLANSLNECVLYIGNDSGSTHIAKALQIPSIVLFGAMPFAWCSPWSNGVMEKKGEYYYIEENVIALQKDLACLPCKKRVCPLGHHDCMRLITPDEVLSLAFTLLKV